jgi:hypothetical protein
MNIRDRLEKILNDGEHRASGASLHRGKLKQDDFFAFLCDPIFLCGDIALVLFIVY